MPRVLRASPILFLVLAIQLTSRAQTSRSGFGYFGEWSDVRMSGSADPHAQGNSLELWKDKGALVGFLSEYVGPVADPPFGPLEHIEVDAASGHLSFSVKLSLGVTNLRGQKDFVPTRDLYFFTGTLRDEDVRGSLEKQDQLRNSPSANLMVIWKRTKRENSFWSDKTAQQWRDFYSPILRARGPQW